MDLTSLFTGENAIVIADVFKPLYSILPFTLPGILTIVGVRKGINFLLAQIKGA